MTWTATTPSSKASSRSPDHFLDMHLDNNIVKIDVLHNPSNEKARTEEFKPSDSANEYFAQEAKMAVQVFGAEFREESAIEGRACGHGPYPDKSDESAPEKKKRRSNCFQFCGSIAHCRGNNGCPHCYAVRQGCLWQKWCR